MSVSLIALCMDLASPRVGANHFAAYMAMHSVSTTIGYQLVGWANETWDFDGMYFVAAAVQLVVTPLVLAVDPGETRRVLPRPAGAPLSVVGLVTLSVLFGGLVLMTAWTLIKTLG
jgi:hypothetical protein